MNREIKFRIYNNETKSFVNIEPLAIMIDEINDLKPHLHIMQYTGIKDKNGVEIYEGDLIHVDYNRLGVLKVYFSKGSYNICNYDLNRCEVIGNIHQNPELLS